MNNKKIIFVSGTGRSGTHLVGRCISSHPNISGRIEVPETFNLITKIATTQDIISIEEKENLLKKINFETFFNYR